MSPKHTQTLSPSTQAGFGSEGLVAMFSLVRTYYPGTKKQYPREGPHSTRLAGPQPWEGKLLSREECELKLEPEEAREMTTGPPRGSQGNRLQT